MVTNIIVPLRIAFSTVLFLVKQAKRWSDAAVDGDKSWETRGKTRPYLFRSVSTCKHNVQRLITYGHQLCKKKKKELEPYGYIGVTYVVIAARFCIAPELLWGSLINP